MRDGNGTAALNTPTERRVSLPRKTVRGSRILLGSLLLLVGASQVYAQSRAASASLMLRIGPQALLQERGGSVLLKIRLVRGTTARLWSANSCTSPAADSTVIAASGVYTIPDSELASTIGNSASGGTEVCLASSDGLLHDALAVEFAGNEGATGAKGSGALVAASGAAAGMPTGWLETAQAGKATWSKP